MLGAHALVPGVIRPRCSECGLIQMPFVLVHAHRITPVRGTDKVRVQIEFLCPICARLTTTSCTITRSHLHAALDRAMDRGFCGLKYANPVRVPTSDTINPPAKRGAAMGPITSEELDRARKLLARTSFKRSTKSWQRFLDRLTRDGDRP